MSDRLEELKQSLPDRYEIEKEIGHGGMAHVYLARDRVVDGPVAVKVVRPEIAEQLDPESFLNELRPVTGLNHPNIMPVLDVGVEGDTYYCVMPHVAGVTLRQRLDREGKVPLGNGVETLRRIIDALAFAHEREVVHRDINAANVMPADGRVVVTDFALAAAINERLRKKGNAADRTMIGSPAYMSPEQARAAPRIDHRADVYSVGALAYEMFSGAAPFTGDPQTVLRAHVDLPAEPLRNRRPDVPVELSSTIMRCLAKNPGDRWQNAAEMLPRVTEAIATRPDPAEKSFLTSRKTNAPAILIALISLILALMLLGAVLL